MHSYDQPPCASALPPSSRHRRGVLLLVVLSILTLFVLLGTTYVVLASRFRSTSRAFLKIVEDENAAPYAARQKLREAALQVIRGTANSHSALRFHDLLRDKYGSGDLAGGRTITQATLLAGEQILRLEISPSASPAAARVLTFLGGPAGVANTSHRIIAAPPTSSDVYILRPQRLVRADVGALVSQRVIVNGLDFAATTPPLAPEAEEYLPNWSLVTTGPTRAANEAYDATDIRNVALGDSAGSRMAFVRPEAVQDAIAYYRSRAGHSLTFEKAAEELELLLINNRFSTATVALEEYQREALGRLRRAVLRPFPFDHYQDAASEVDFAGRQIVRRDPYTGKTIPLDSLLNPVGDVDNDGDGILESVWVDIGLAPITLFDRTVVKPLVAIHVIDLDGRLNLNVHGSQAHLFAQTDLRDDALARRPSTAGDMGDPTTLPQSRGLAGMLRSGIGFGPADIRLDTVLNTNQIDGVFLGSTAVTGIGSGIRRDVGQVVGRYGDGIGTLSSLPASLPAPGRFDVADLRPGTDRSLWADRTVPGGFTSPSDYWSRLLLGIDHRGQPYYINRMEGTNVRDDERDSPYELDLTVPRDANPYAKPAGSPTAWVDEPFTPSELEALLRSYDADNAATLPPRALALMLASNVVSRHVLTTESWDTPALVIPPPSGIDEPDLLNGLKMELNREFGDGFDNNGNRTMDEPGETDPTLPPEDRDLFSDPSKGWWLTGGRVSPGNQPGPDLPGLRARQVMAWDLYRLLRFLRPPTLNAPPLDDRAIAQWAVNVVDFLDSDSIMTPFRYSGDNTLKGDEFVVWGCENPDLIITETLAFHDRAIADTNRDDRKGRLTTDDDADPDFDQVRVPQGSVFVELHALRSASAQRLPRELYDENGRLDLARVPEDRPNAPPVWRLSFTRLRDIESVEADDIGQYDPFRRRLSASEGWHETFAPRGQSYGELIGDDGTPPIELERYVWFTGAGPNNERGALPDTLPALPPNHFPAFLGYPVLAPSRHNTFCFRGGTSLLAAGEFLVVGPRQKTVLGSKDKGMSPTNRYGVPASQAIVLGPEVRVLGDDGQIQPQLSNPDPSVRAGDSVPPGAGGRPETRSCWVAAPRPANWTSHASFVSGLNLSEPLGHSYYAEPPPGVAVDAATGRIAYCDLDVEDNQLLFRDFPEDYHTYSPLERGKLLSQGTYLNAANVFLERLADPTRPHDPRAVISNLGVQVSNPSWNPYIVVDFMPIDLTVFNGETSSAQRNTRDPETRDHPDRPFWFFTRQRGFDAEFVRTTDGNRQFKLSEVLFPKRESAPANPYSRIAPHPWRPANPWDKDGELTPPIPPDVTQAEISASTSNFRYQLGHVPKASDPLGIDDRVPTHTLGWVNQAYGRRLGSMEVPAVYAGAASRPLPWITWNDRPFASAYELLLVPRTAPSRLLTDYRSLAPIDPDAPDDLGKVDNDDPFGAKARGWHLMPFTSLTDYQDGTGNRFQRADALGQIFTYVHVRSRFAGTSKVLVGNFDPDDILMERFRPPFNKVTTFREPGRVNLNTIPPGAGEKIWNGLLGVAPRPPNVPEAEPWISADPTWSDLRSRVGQDVLHPGRDTPLLLRGGSSVAHEIFPRSMRNVVDGDLSHPAFDTDTAWFRFEPLIRAASNTTARSEVYAIWITLGLFEVADMGGTLPVAVHDGFMTPVNRYPDGYRLLREYGTDTGEAKRHRAFFIFDRSIPVGYRAGSDLNVQDGILVESYFD